MTNRQKELSRYQLRREKELIKRLEEYYQKASDDLASYIRKLTDEYTATGLQSKVYQKRFQQALKAEVDKTLERIRSGVYQSIEDYRTECYENGFLGAMYDMQGQGVPLVIPIDPEKMVRAITIDSKLSKSLYEALGINLNTLKDVVRDEISRGFATGTMYEQIASRINNRMHTGRYNAIRIARTEGQRITNEATYQAQMDAASRGAEIVKQWNGILDGRIRPSHAELHGQSQGHQQAGAGHPGGADQDSRRPRLTLSYISLYREGAFPCRPNWARGRSSYKTIWALCMPVPGASGAGALSTMTCIPPAVWGWSRPTTVSTSSGAFSSPPMPCRSSLGRSKSSSGTAAPSR